MGIHPHLRRLKARMVMEDVSHEDIEKALGRSRTYVSRRMTGLEDWTAADMQVIAKLLHLSTRKDFTEHLLPDMEWDEDKKQIRYGA